MIRKNKLFVTSNFQLNPSELRLEKGAKFPHQLSVTRKGDVMILRTPYHLGELFAR
nr:BarA sensory histidine kinase [Raoultella sp. NCTC 9187]